VGEVPIHIGPGADDGPDGTDHGGAWPGEDDGVASSRRVVREPSRRLRLVAVLVVAGLVVGGMLSFGGERVDEPVPPPTPPDPAGEAYAAALRRLGQAGSFAYHGTVQATERSPLRPGAWLDDRVVVEGVVLLPHSITREVAVTADGDEAVETVTSGSTAWSRAASSREVLSSAPWKLVAWTDRAPGPSPSNPESFDARRLGIALVVDVVRAAGNRYRSPPDPGGSRSLHATVPIGGGHRVHSGDLLAGAEVVLGLDDAGDVAELTLSSVPANGRRLRIDLELERLGEPGLITASDVGHPARGGLVLDDLAASGVTPVEPSRLPPGWALTTAQVARTGRLVMCGGGTGRCVTSDEGCPVLQLDYRDITRVSGGWLSLSMMSESCFAGRSGANDDVWAGSIHAGRFIGSVDPSKTTIGVMTDGGTTISFTTDLSAADVAAVLATLAPFDRAAEPGALPGIPSPRA
jgi:hypothetical protein